ncbi:MAG: hypothetical protein RLZZ618_2175 [Pseudomonadota bacterium]
MSVLAPATTKLSTLVTTVVVGVALFMLLTWKLACDGCLREVSTGSAVAMPSLMAAGSNSPDASVEARSVIGPDSASNRSTAQIEEALFVKGSLRGTDHPAWGFVRGEPIAPKRALRDRFDYYLLALSEASMTELTALVRAHAERDLGLAAAADIIGVWERYLRLQRHAFQHVANPADRASMQVALQEHQQVRQVHLGMHWAQAFYGEEEKSLADTLAQAADSPLPRRDAAQALFVPPAGTDPQALHQQRVAQFGASAADRLHKLDEQDAQWARRLADVRAEVDALRLSAGLSDVQRDEAIARFLERSYPDASDRLRASALLGV